MAGWFKKPVNIIITVGAALMAVVAIGLIIWGVTHHREEGLLEVCWEGGVAVPVGGIEGDADGSCERPEELAWPQEQIPLTVAPVAATGESMGTDSPQVRVLDSTIRDINAQVGFELLRLACGDPDSADGRVHYGGAFESARDGKAVAGRGDGENGGGAKVVRNVARPAGYVVHRRVGPVLRGDVYLRSDVESVDRTLYLVGRHELLHFVGLAHDDFESSVMFPMATDDSISEAMGTAHITDFDRALLRSMYHQ